MSDMNLKLETANFLKYLTVEKGFSAVTIKNYAGHLAHLADFMQGQELNFNSVRDYRNFLAAKNLSKGTQNSYLIALRSFLKYLTRQGIMLLPLDCVELIKTSERQIKVLNSSQINRLLQKPRWRKLSGLRDRTILELLFATGLRVSELCSLNRTDINFQTGEFSIKGKGGRVRPIFLSARAMKWLGQYLKRRKDVNPALFPAMRGSVNRLQPRSIQQLVQKYAAKIGLQEKLTPHMIRHLYACDLLSHGADLRSIQELLGHKNLATTQVYTHVTNPQLKQTYLKFHGKELWL